jgi:hypothetical protein
MNRPFGGATLLAAAGITLTLAISMLTGGLLAIAAGPPSVGLGTATSFAILAGAGITNTGPTTVNGDVGTFPTTTQTGFGSVTITGTNHAGDAVTQGAKNDLVTAYNTAAGSGPTTPVAANLGGQNLVPGVYNSASSLALTGVLTLTGTSTDVWIFQAGSTLTTATGSSVVFSGGAQACNVFWQVGSSATLGTGSSFKGTILALTSITATTGATIEGRLLARNGAVTLDTNTITRSTCVVQPTQTPSAPTVTITPAPTATPAATVAPSAAPAATATPMGATPAPTVKSLPLTSTAEDDTFFVVLALVGIIFMILYMVARARRRARNVPA